MTKRTGAKGGKKKAGAKTCGAKRVICHCTHHRREHISIKPTVRGACQHPGCLCTGFHPKACQSDDVYPNGRCYLHGGPTPAGPASPHFKTGKFSKFLPSQLAAQYELARRDPELISVREELALIDVREVQILQLLHHGEAGALWRRLKTVRDRLLQFRQDKKLKEMGEAFDELFRVIDAGVQDADAWNELRDVADLRRRLVETQSKRDRDLKQSVAITELLVLMGQIAGSVQKHVSDPKVVGAITNDLRRLIGPGLVVDAEPAPS